MKGMRFPQASYVNDEGDGTLPMVLDDDAPESRRSSSGMASSDGYLRMSL